MPRLLIAVITLLALAYGLPLFAPPAAVFPAPAGPDFTLWQRIFPGVPVVWITTRLLCLALALILIAWRLKLPLSLHLATIATPKATPAVVTPLPGRVWQWLALGLALTQVAAAFLTASFSPALELAYFAALGAPAVVLALSQVAPVNQRGRTIGSGAAPALLLAACWLAWVLPHAWRSPRAASVIDCWVNVRALLGVAEGTDSALSGGWNPGLSNAYMFLEGVSLLGDHGVTTSDTFAWLQLVHAFWAVVCSVVVAALGKRMVGNGAALVAQATFLFSPFVMSFPYSPLPTFLGPLCASTLLLLYLKARDLTSPAALAAFAAVAGFSARIPQISLLTLLLSLLLLHPLIRAPRTPWLTILIAIACGLAALLPGFPSIATLATSASLYTVGTGHYAAIVLAFFGQHDVLGVERALVTGNPGPWDLALGALLAPFAIARTPMRLWGDSLFDPWGAFFIAVGMLLCLRDARRNAAARLLLAVGVAGSVTAFVSGGDAVSHTRLAPASVALALLAGVGFEALRAGLVPRLSVSGLVAATIGAIVLSGVWLFEVISPRILPASWMDTSFAALGTGAHAARAAFADFGEISAGAHIDTIATLLPAPPQASIDLSAFSETLATPSSPQVYFWSPAMEQAAALSCRVCDQWPGATLYTLGDQAGLFFAFAAAPPGVSWRPDLAPLRWSQSACHGAAAQITEPKLVVAPQCPAETIWLPPSRLQELKCGLPWTPAPT